MAHSSSTRPPLVFSFPTLEAAAQARDDLLGSGFAAGDVRVSTSADEAGPVQGNWIVGNGIAMDGSASEGVIAGGEIPYDANFAETVNRGTCLLHAQPRDDDSARRAGDIAARHGGVDVRARSNASDEPGGSGEQGSSRQGDAVPARARRD